MIYFKCLHCGENMEAPASLKGQLLKCPKCGILQKVKKTGQITTGIIIITIAVMFIGTGYLSYQIGKIVNSAPIAMEYERAKEENFQKGYQEGYHEGENFGIEEGGRLMWAYMNALHDDDYQEGYQTAIDTVQSYIQEHTEKPDNLKSTPVAESNNEIETQSNMTEDAAKLEKLHKKIQKMMDVIELDEQHIKNLPQVTLTIGRKNDYDRYSKKLDNMTQKEHFLSDEINNYKQIIQLAEKYPSLRINIMDTKKKLIRCEGQLKETQLQKESLQKDFFQSSTNKTTFR
jgi:DNA-directed RNA polymerase subunit RPC12/RpoP